MTKNRIVIFLEGGLIQQIDSEQAVDVIILDHDTEGACEGDTRPIRDIDGTVEDVYVSQWYIEPDPETVEYFFNQVGKEV